MERPHHAIDEPAQLRELLPERRQWYADYPAAAGVPKKVTLAAYYNAAVTERRR